MLAGVDRAYRTITIVDYEYRAQIRYGAGLPPHPELAAIIGAGREHYVARMERWSDLPADFAGLGYQQIQCWTDPYDRTMLRERMCLWRRPGTCDSASAKPLAPDVGEAFEELMR